MHKLSSNSWYTILCLSIFFIDLSRLNDSIRRGNISVFKSSVGSDGNESQSGVSTTPTRVHDLQLLVACITELDITDDFCLFLEHLSIWSTIFLSIEHLCTFPSMYVSFELSIYIRKASLEWVITVITRYDLHCQQIIWNIIKSIFKIFFRYIHMVLNIIKFTSSKYFSHWIKIYMTSTIYLQILRNINIFIKFPFHDFKFVTNYS
jgi:hypothetical protein